MNQTDHSLDLSIRHTPKHILLDEMEQVMSWGELLALITPHALVAKTGHLPFYLAMLRIYCLQQWFGLTNTAMEEALHDTPLYSKFARLYPGTCACQTRAPSCDFGIC